MSADVLVLALLPTALVASYLVGSIPWSYLIVRHVSHVDITEHGTGNVGAMNVRRSTGSWTWFAVAVLADGLKGLVPVLMARGAVAGFSVSGLTTPWGIAAPLLLRAGQIAGETTFSFWLILVPPLAVLGAVMGHNYSLWLAIRNRCFRRTGKGLATGAGALLAYDWRYFVAVVVVALLVIAVTRYMMAGQVAAAAALPVTALLLHSPDWPFALLMGLIVYSAHHKRFIGLLQGREPRLYVDDGSGPRG